MNVTRFIFAFSISLSSSSLLLYNGIYIWLSKHVEILLNYSFLNHFKMFWYGLLFKREMQHLLCSFLS